MRINEDGLFSTHHRAARPDPGETLLDVLTSAELATAKDQGWTLVNVFDLDTRALRPTVLPLKFGELPFKTVNAANTWIVRRAREGDALALKTLRILMQGHA